jgi:hypothetical protein
MKTWALTCLPLASSEVNLETHPEIRTSDVIHYNSHRNGPLYPQ